MQTLHVVAALLLNAALWLITQPIRAAEIVDVSTLQQDRFVSAHFTDDNLTAQTFTVGTTGQLTRLDIAAYRWQAMNADVFFEIRTTSGGMPNDDAAGLLARHVMPYNQLPRYYLPEVPLVSIDLSDAPVSVTAGDLLSIVCYHGPEFSNGEIPEVWVTKPRAYEGGALVVKWFGEPWRLINSDERDIQFRTFITPIPEPSPLLLSITSAILTLWGRRAR